MARQRRIDQLAADPFPVGAPKLHAEERFYRIRVDDYRVIYQVETDVRVVIVAKIGHRRGINR